MSAGRPANYLSRGKRRSYPDPKTRQTTQPRASRSDVSDVLHREANGTCSVKQAHRSYRKKQAYTGNHGRLPTQSIYTGHHVTSKNTFWSPRPQLKT